MINILNHLNFLTIATALAWIQFSPMRTVNIETNLTPMLPMGVTAIAFLRCRSKRFATTVLKVD
jgi:hypothetical protein